LNLPLLSVGAVGFVSVVGHVVGVRLRELLDAYENGDVARATVVNRSLLPIYTGIFRTQGAILVKAALNLIGQPAGPTRSPLVDATIEQLTVLRADLVAGGIEVRA
jgi:4-hydroxy-tetrahydrodipicolinate synthase